MKTKKPLLLLRVALAFFSSALFVFSQESVEDWQKKAVEDFPDLGTSGSLLNLKFIQMVNSLKISNPAFFNDPKWPYTLARQIGKPNLIPGLDGGQQPAAGLSAAPGNNAKGEIDALSLATEYKNDQKAADTQYVGRRLTVTGQISKIVLGNNSSMAAFVYLNTGGGLSRVKVELNKMKEYKGTVSSGYYYTEKNGFELRVRDESVMEVRSHHVHTHNDYYYYGTYGSNVKNGEWCPVLSKGDVIKVVGTCSGRYLDIVLSNAELQK